jgi:hypothetical protein
VKVYRVEKYDGEGPFSPGDHRLEMNKALGWNFHADQMKFPEPSQEGLELEWGSDWICGCQSLELLLEWFPKVIHSVLSDFGYRLTEWAVDVKEIQIGTRQVIFKRHSAQLVDSIHFELI